MRQGVRRNMTGLDYLQIVRSKGREYRYLRIPGKARVALPSGVALNSREFLAAYLAARDGAGTPSAPVAGTIAAMVKAYIAAPKHRAHSAVYAKMIERHASDIAAKGKSALIGDLGPQHIRADLSRLDPHAARKRLKAWRLICGHAIDIGAIHTDPSAAVNTPAIPKTDGHPPWTADDIAKFRAHWPPESTQRRAFELLFWTAARVSDAHRLGPAMVGADGVLSFKQAKTGKPAFVPWTCALPAHADESDRAHLFNALRHAPRGFTFLVTQTERTRTATGLKQMIATAARAAGVNKSAHGLRKARAIALAENGATTHQISAWTGHATLSEVAHYTAGMDRRAAVIGRTKDSRAV